MKDFSSYSFFDTHAHTNIEPLLSESDKIFNECEQNKILINCVGVDIKTSLIAIEQSKKHSNCICSVGIHPTEIHNKKQLKEIKKIIKSNIEYIYAIGETGLDYYHKPYNDKLQKYCFIKHIKMAIKFNLPLIIHVRNSMDDLIKILKKYYKKIPNILIHCFDSNYEDVIRLNNFHCYFAIGGKATYKNSEYLLEAIKYIPNNKILVETDCPFLNPFEKKQINFPQNVIKILDFLKLNKQQVFLNSLNLFMIDFNTKSSI